MSYRNYAETANAETVANKVLDNILADAALIGADPSDWRQDQWNEVTRDAIYAMDNELDGDDIRQLIDYATEGMSGWEILDGDIMNFVATAIWCRWEDRNEEA